MNARGHFNPRTPRGVRHDDDEPPVKKKGFQSTHPARGATKRSLSRGVTTKISIHAPREGCDYFYVWSWRYVDISIHAPREGCDWITSAPATKEFDNFNPRTPRGVRQFHQPSYSATGGFQSTHPARGATSTSNSSRARIAISIHAPREGCDD